MTDRFFQAPLSAYQTEAEVVQLNADIAAGKAFYVPGSGFKLGGSSASAGQRYTLRGVGRAAQFVPQSTVTALAATAAPVATGRPVITGSFLEGTNVSGSNGTWDNVPASYAYQWKTEDGVDIAGATSATLAVTSALRFRRPYLVVTATNANGTGVATSVPQAMVTPATQAAVSYGFALNTRMAIEGDSITAGSNGPAWIWQFILSTGGRFYMPPGFNTGVAGQQASLLATAPKIAAVMSRSPKVVSLLAGTNDLGLSAQTPAQIAASLATCCAGYLAAGAQYVLLSTVLPRFDAGWSRDADRLTLNNLIRAMATDQIRIVENDNLSDSSYFRVGEGVHPGWKGAVQLGKNIAAVALPLLDLTQSIQGLYSASNNLIPNAALAGTSGTKTGSSVMTGSLADGWTVSSSVANLNTVCSKIANFNGSGVEGQRFAITTQAAGEVTISVPITYNAFAGELYECWCEVDITMGGTTQGIAAALSDGSAVSPSYGQSISYDSGSTYQGMLRAPPVAALSADATTVTFQVKIKTGGGNGVLTTITIGRPVMRKVPAGT